MTILLDQTRNVSIIDDEPTAIDRAYAAESSPFADEHHVDAPTPADALACTLDEATDYDSWPEWCQAERWTLADDDARWHDTIAGGAGSAPTRSGSTRVDAEEERGMWGR